MSLFISRTDRQSNRMKTYLGLLGFAALLFVQAVPLFAQQIPASDLPPAGTDTGLEGKYDPQNGIAQLIRDKSSESAASKIFEDEHVLVFMPLPDEEVVVPGHVLVVPKRLGARNLLDLKPEEMCTVLAAFKKLGSHRKTDWEQPVSDCSQITGSAAAKPFTIRIFTSYPLLVGKRLERPRREGSCRKRSIKTSQRSCARPGRKEVTSDLRKEVEAK